MKRLLLALLLLWGAHASAQDVVLPNPLDAGSAAEGWIWAMRTWAPPAAAKDLAGGRFQAQLGVGPMGYAIRADASGLPANFSTDKPETYHTIEAHVAVHRNMFALPGLVQLGPAIGLGAGLPLVGDKDTPKLFHAMTWGAGFHVNGPGWWAYGVYGVNQALPGSAVTITWHIATTSRTAAVGTVAIGRGTYYSQLGVAVRWF